MLDVSERWAQGLAALLAGTFAYTQQPELDTKGSESRLHEESSHLQQRVLQKGTTFLKKLEAGEMTEAEFPHSKIRRRYQELAGEEETWSLRDVRNKMWRLFGDRDHMDLMYTKLASATTEDHIGRWWHGDKAVQRKQLQALQDSFHVRVHEHAVAHPDHGLERIVRDELSELDTSWVDWQQHPLNEKDLTRWFELKEDVSRGESMPTGASLAYLLQNTDEAFDTFYQHHGDDLLWSDLRTRELSDLKKELEVTRELHDDIRKRSDEKEVPAGRLAYVLSGYFSKQPRTALKRRELQHSERERKAHVTIDKIVQATLPHLGDLYKDDIDHVVIADRGARPYGIILETLIDDLDLPEIDISYFKFSQPSKIAEAYADTDAYEMPGVFKQVKRLRSMDRSFREAGDKDASESVRQRIHELIQDNAEEYHEAYARAFPIQVERAQQYIGDIRGDKTRVYDDNVTTSRTACNAVSVLTALGAASVDVQPLLDTPQNPSDRAVLRDPQAMHPDFANTQGWRYDLLWKAGAERSGVRYGIDAGVDDPEKLFRRVRDLEALTVDPPQEKQYSTEETEELANRFLRDTILVKPGEQHAHQAEKREFQDTLERYNVKERELRGVEQQVNALQNRMFRRWLRDQTRTAAREAQAMLGTLDARGLAQMPSEPIGDSFEQHYLLHG